MVINKIMMTIIKIIMIMPDYNHDDHQQNHDDDHQNHHTTLENDMGW